MTAERGDSIRWSDETYTLVELVGELESKLPCIVKVMTGYSGPSSLESLSLGQVIRVQSAGRQTRVLGKDDGGRMFSIPLQLSVPFAVEGQSSTLPGRKKQHSLAAIVENNTPHMKVALVDNAVESQPVSQGRELLRLGSMQLVSKYEEMSIVGNMIADGIMSSKPIAIPTHVNASVSLAVDRNDGNEEAWLKLKAEYDRSAAKVDFASVFPADDVRMYSVRQVEDVIRCATTASSDTVYFSLITERSPDESQYTSLDNAAAATTENSFSQLGAIV